MLPYPELSFSIHEHQVFVDLPLCHPTILISVFLSFNLHLVQLYFSVLPLYIETRHSRSVSSKPYPYSLPQVVFQKVSRLMYTVSQQNFFTREECQPHVPTPNLGDQDVFLCLDLHAGKYITASIGPEIKPHRHDKAKIPFTLLLLYTISAYEWLDRSSLLGSWVLVSVSPFFGSFIGINPFPQCHPTNILQFSIPPLHTISYLILIRSFHIIV